MLSKLCKDIHTLFLASTKGMNRELFDKARELSGYFMQNHVTAKSLEPVFELERKLIAGKGPYKQFLEEEAFRALFISALYCAPEHAGEKRLTLSPALLEKPASLPDKEQYRIALSLVGFSKEVFQIQNPRDAFNNKRKSLAMDLIGRVAAYYDVPEAMELCMAALKSNKKTLVLAAAELFGSYRRGRDLSLTPEMIKRLDEIIMKTKDRSVAVTALNLQVEAGLISEFGALSRIDDWKERNPYWL